MEKALKVYQLVVIVYFILMGSTLLWTKHYVGAPIYFTVAAAFTFYMLRINTAPSSGT